jgi:hypothetical protein
MAAGKAFFGMLAVFAEFDLAIAITNGAQKRLPQLSRQPD